MNALSRIAIPFPTEAMAHSLLSGARPDTSVGSAADWLAAAQEAADGIPDKLDDLIERADHYPAFEAWSERFDRAGNYSFDDWFSGDVGSRLVGRVS